MKTFCCLILSLVGVLLLAGVSQANNEHSVAFKGSNYIFVNTKLSWEDAKKKCEEREKNLVTVESIEEKKFLSSQIANLPFQDEPTDFWINEKYFDPLPEDGAYEQCIALTSIDKNLYPCNTPTPYICEGFKNSSIE